MASRRPIVGHKVLASRYNLDVTLVGSLHAFDYGVRQLTSEKGAFAVSLGVSAPVVVAVRSKVNWVNICIMRERKLTTWDRE